MNLVLFEPGELDQPLPRTDPRARHVLEVLRRQTGQSFDAGVVDGDIGTATIVAQNEGSLQLSFAPVRTPPALPAITLLVGMCRPQTARDLLRDAATMGVTAMHFVATERSDRSYAQSSLWTSGEWRRQLLIGAAQAFDTRLPELSWSSTLDEQLSKRTAQPGTRVALDNYEASTRLVTANVAATHVTLAIGPERGWGPKDREQLRAQGCTLAHLGPRVLRVESACVAALAILAARG
jgi:RsmE family RNA methyltransferase